MSPTPSISSIEEDASSKVKFDDLTQEWRDSVKEGMRSLKKENRKAKKVVIKGQAHQSSTVAEHSNVISCQLRDADGSYLGSVHLDEEGHVYPNSAWTKNAAKE